MQPTQGSEFLKIGHPNTLVVQSRDPYGLILISETGQTARLPAQESPKNVQIGATLDVFVYTDPDGEAMASSTPAKVCVGSTACLQVVAETDAGLWLNWGLAQDLLLPVSEQAKLRKERPGKTRTVFVYVFVDDYTGKITATTRLHRHFSELGDDYTAQQEVSLCVTAKTELGYKVLIDEKTLGVLYQDQTHRALEVGEKTQGYIKRIRPDGKVDTTLYAASPHQASDLESRIIEFLQRSGGTSTLGDKSSPEAIFAQFQVSKKHYKRALGSLYRARKIVIRSDLIELT